MNAEIHHVQLVRQLRKTNKSTLAYLTKVYPHTHLPKVGVRKRNTSTIENIGGNQND